MLANRLFRCFATKQIPFNNWKIVKGDNVMVNCGKDKGKVGKVLKVNRKENEVLVEGVNMRYRNVKSDDQSSTNRNLVPHISPIHVSNVNLLDPTIGKGTKVRSGYLSDGTKVRISKMTNEIIPKPNTDYLKYKARHRKKRNGESDTTPELALSQTYKGEDFYSIRKEFEKYIAEKERLESLLVFDK